MKRKTTIYILLLLMLIIHVEAQELPLFHPFKGFHIGITGQAEFIEKCSFASLFDFEPFDPLPKGRWSYGWEAGIEFSYHFAKYFGFSAGINYGTAMSYNCAIYLCIIPGFNDKWGIANDYSPAGGMRDKEIMFPVKFEFHYPLHKNLFFSAEAGVKIKGFFHWLEYKRSGNGYFSYSSELSFLIYPPYVPDGTYETINYFKYWSTRDISKISCDLLLGIGLYYQLSHGDLLRFSIGLNKSFNNVIEGYYIYHLSGSAGTFSAKNDFIYTQFSYIHTLNWQKTKKHLKQNEYSFASKKERRKKIMELLNGG